MPLYLLGYVIAALLSLAYPVAAFFLYREWWLYRFTAKAAYATHCLHSAIAITVMMVLGRYLFRFLLSKRRKGDDQPKRFRAHNCETIRRPDGTKINIEHYGKLGGSAILLVHGWNTNLQSWYYQKKYFEFDHHVILMDLPGAGRSTWAKNGDYSLSRLAADINAVLEHTGVHNVVLWGHSMGAMAILTLLAKHRSIVNAKIKGIILEHTTHTNPLKSMKRSKWMSYLQKPLFVPMCWIAILLSPILWITKWMSYFNGTAHILARWLTFAGTQTQKQLDFSTRLSARTAPATSARGLLAMFRFDVSEELKNIDLPTLIIAAHKDRLTRPDTGRYMRDNMPNSHLTEVWPASHHGLLERHREVNALADNFIRSLK